MKHGKGVNRVLLSLALGLAFGFSPLAGFSATSLSNSSAALSAPHMMRIGIQNIQSLSVSGAVKNALNKQTKYQNELISQLKSKMQFKSVFTSHLAQKEEINFLSLQIAEGFNLLQGIHTSADATNPILKSMLDLAIQVATGTLMPSERMQANVQFQALLHSIPQAQTVWLLTGPHTLSGGLVQISLGAQTTPIYTIPVPAFDAASLGLGNLDIASVTDAITAIDVLQSAIYTVNKVGGMAVSMAIQDMQAMLLSIQNMLAQELSLTEAAANLILQTSSVDPNVLTVMNIDLSYLISAMRQMQTYVSLKGPIVLGGGNIHLQVGNNAPLTISAPVVDVDQTGLAAMDISTPASAATAMTVILDRLHHFVYFNENAGEKVK